MKILSKIKHLSKIGNFGKNRKFCRKIDNFVKNGNLYNRKENLRQALKSLCEVGLALERAIEPGGAGLCRVEEEPDLPDSLFHFLQQNGDQ